MLDVPYISVIILSWNRKQYIKRAVNSVLNQTLTSELIEIIITKNYYDQDIDYFLKVNNVKSIYLPVDEVGTKIADAINIARGTIICFLDDDDTFEPDKLSYVCDVFTSDSDIGYIHDSINLINEDGGIIKSSPLIKSKNHRLLLKPEDKNDSHFKKIMKDIHVGPASALSIRREILVRFLEPLHKLKLSFDGFSLIVGLCSGHPMLFSELVLTNYRIHSTTTHAFTSFSDFKAVKINYFRLVAQDYSLFSDMLESGEFPKFGYYFALHSNIFKLLIGKESKIHLSEVLKFTKLALSTRDRSAILSLLPVYATFVSNKVGWLIYFWLSKVFAKIAVLAV